MSFFRLITHIFDVDADHLSLTLAVADAADAAVTVTVMSWAVAQAGNPADGENDATQVTSRPSSHAQHHSIADGG